ncbi:DUF4129 domain-containing protein [Halosimplex salinum]|uniref:DUF4129 domain-containing protein n=1 Tax=Halosimplex salinum TaxID=1710538 RepID=UPI001F410502|nr:DUF4129 domain-containing protein [Halosimplex salinum]
MDEYLSRKSLRVVVVGIVAMAAIAVGAATIASVVDAGPSETGEPVQDGDPNPPPIDGGSMTPTPDGPEEPTQTPGTPGEPREPIEMTRCIKPLASWYGGVVYFGAFAALVVTIKRRYSAGASLLGLYAIAPPALLSYFLSTDCPSWGGPGVGNGSLGGDLGGDFAGNPLVSTNLPPEVILGAFGVVLVGTAAVLLRASGGQTVTQIDQGERATDDGDPVDPRDFAVAAGRVADRLEARNADVDNEVYRAWWEMTSLLDVADPDTATPGEFADAAVAVGLDETDVAELTRLFEEVRYGERDVVDREERAVSVFRSIEESYGDE